MKDIFVVGISTSPCSSYFFDEQARWLVVYQDMRNYKAGVYMLANFGSQFQLVDAQSVARETNKSIVLILDLLDYELEEDFDEYDCPMIHLIRKRG